MKTKLVLFLLSLCIIAGCNPAFGQKLYPVQGPLAAQTPPQVFSAKLTGGPKSGGISLVLTNGETFKGKWATVAVSFVNTKTPGTPASYPPQPNLAFAWDAVYGQGYVFAHILGESIGQAVLTGNQGTVIQLEFFDGRIGVAVDNKGNIYKMAW
ncbi:MAG: hypothetical protein WCA89_02290 [Terracidiphilus sp.]|jgi:hypothetical protein